MAAMPNPAVWSPRRVEDLSFFRALVPRNFPLSEGGRRRFKLRARSSVNVNGRPSRMVPVEEAMSVRKNSKTNTNGSAANGSNWALAPRKMVRRFENRSILPPIDVKELPLDEGFSWSKENYNRLERTLDVWTFVLSLRVRTYLDEAKWSYIGGFTEEKQKTRRRKTASWLRECILQLGPTYIKIGQVSSTRSDLFPKEFVEELAKLQVHRAVLQNGELVVVKVQRPGLKKLFDIDFENLKLIAEFFQNSESFGGPTRDWIGVYEECRTILYREIDYINEGRNADRFRRDFRNIKWVRVPAIYWDYTTVKVLTMEYVPGIKINNVDLLDAGNYDRSLIARRSIESYLIQILKNEFFHADPHPGNIAIDVDGSLIYYDFGMMGEIKSFTRDRLLQMFYAVYEKDAKKVVESLIELGALQPTGDMGSVRRSVQFFLNNLLTQIPNQEATLSAVGEDLFSIAVDQPFRFPATFTFVIRAFITLEGTGYILDPNFSFAKIAAPYAQELLDMRNSKSNGTHLVEEIQRQANDVRDATVSMPYRIQRIDEFIQQLERGDLKLRVRVFEAERAARKASVMQMATIYTVLGGTLLNTGAMLSSQGMQNFAIVSYVGAGLFTILVVRAMKRVQILDKFEKMI
uniref:ABC1 atypical kinase-like domain-containing protein n=1 Tax=Araucaria cunninghamii TaxID=56994 RepID=A0A0D6QZN2_ARACU